MSPKKQTELFEQVRKRFPRWSKKRASGYIHGVQDGLLQSTPDSDYVQRCLRSKDNYAAGYVYGFIDAFGDDALTSEWFKEPFGFASHTFPIDYRWWQDET